VRRDATRATGSHNISLGRICNSDGDGDQTKEGEPRPWTRAAESPSRCAATEDAVCYAEAYARDQPRLPGPEADSHPGKSSITLRLVRSQWTSDYDPTIEDSYSVTRTIDGIPYHLMLTDTAGQEEYRGLWAASNLQSDAFLLVYDITSPNSLDALEYFMEMIDMEEETRIDNGKTPPVKIVAGNKCDLQGQRQIQAKDGLEWARRRKCGFMETSAREMVNIEETFARTCPPRCSCQRC
jgi:small GTP-binding protein